MSGDMITSISPDSPVHPAGTIKRPRPVDIIIEGATRLLDINDERWDSLGAYPMARTGLVKEPARMADGMRIGNAWFCGLWRKRWEAAKKPLKLVHLLIPALTPSEVPFRLANHPHDAPNLGVFYRRGGIEARGWSAAWAPTYAESIRREGLAKVAAVLDDEEYFPNTDGVGPQGPGNNDPSQGWWLRAWADPRAIVPAEFKGIGQSLVRWRSIADREKLLSGKPIPPIPAQVTGPNCWDSLATAFEAQALATTMAYQRYSAPITISLDCRFGAWMCYSRSRAHPVLNNPGQYKYNLQGDFPLGLQIPVNYCATEATMSDAAYHGIGDGDPRWPTAENWVAGTGGTSRYGKGSMYELTLRAVFAVQTANARSMHLANPDVPLFPCIMCDFGGGYNQDPWTPAGGNDGFDSLRCELMAQYCYDLRFCNVAGFWYWAPDWDENPAVRERLWKFIAAYRAKFAA